MYVPGTIHFCGYWRKYSLTLAVHDDGTVTQLDAFADVNQSPRHAVTRTHRTAFDPRRDRTLTVEEFYRTVLCKEPT